MTEEPQKKKAVSIILCAESADEGKVVCGVDLLGRLAVPATALKPHCHVRL